MTYSTKWEREYDERTTECLEAALKAAQVPDPYSWPVSGARATQWLPEDLEG